MSEGKVPSPEAIAAVVRAMRAGHTETPGISSHCEYGYRTVQRALEWLLAEGCAKCVVLPVPYVPGKSFRGTQHVWTLIKEPRLQLESDSPFRDSQREPWQFGLLVAAYSRPKHVDEQEPLL
jgi:hypothetical protein